MEWFYKYTCVVVAWLPCCFCVLSVPPLLKHRPCAVYTQVLCSSHLGYVYFNVIYKYIQTISKPVIIYFTWHILYWYCIYVTHVDSLPFCINLAHAHISLFITYFFIICATRSSFFSKTFSRCGICGSGLKVDKDESFRSLSNPTHTAVSPL